MLISTINIICYITLYTCITILICLLPVRIGQWVNSGIGPEDVPLVLLWLLGIIAIVLIASITCFITIFVIGVFTILCMG